MPETPFAILDRKYELLAELGRGGMGTVYEARNLATGRRVAIKLIGTETLSKEPEIRARFRRETMATASVESQYIAHALDAGVDPTTGAPYLVMDLLTGEDLERTVHRLGPLAPELALRLAAQACLGLSKAHEAGIVHRDIKPANLFLSRRDGTEVVVKLLDFGIAKVQTENIAGASQTRTGSILGSPLYMSPEQAMGDKVIDHRTDVWSLGVALFEALCGRAPHADTEAVGALIVRICGEPAPSVSQFAPWVPPSIVAVVSKALAIDPRARFSSTKEMFDAIRSLLPGGSYSVDESMLVPFRHEALGPAATGASPPTADPIAPAYPPAALHASTQAGFTSSGLHRGLAPKPNRSLVAIAGGVLVAIGIAAVWGYHLKHSGAKGTSTTAAPDMPTVFPSQSSSSPAAVESAAAVPTPDAQREAPATVVAAPGATTDPTKAATAGAQGKPVPRTTPPKSTADGPKANCQPPYSLNANGVKVWKPECF
jgi:serine/threonine-protein kinase